MPATRGEWHIHECTFVVQQVLVLYHRAGCEVDILAAMLIVVDGHWIVIVLMLGYDVWIEYLIA